MKQATQFISMKLDSQRMLATLSQCEADIIMLANHILPGCHVWYRHWMIMMAARVVILRPCLAKRAWAQQKESGWNAPSEREGVSISDGYFACWGAVWCYRGGGWVEGMQITSRIVDEPSGPQVHLAASDTSPCVYLLRQHCDGLVQNLHTPFITNLTEGNLSAIVAQWCSGYTFKIACTFRGVASALWIDSPDLGEVWWGTNRQQVPRQHFDGCHTLYIIPLGI